MWKRNTGIGILGLAAILIGILWFSKSQQKVDFNTQVKPILNRECMSCHGGVKSNGGLSFLFEEEALGVMESGQRAIVPGHPDRSELIKRIESTDPDLRMPFEKAPLSEEEVHVFHDWIKQGAKWEVHWAYHKVENPVLPPVRAEVGGSTNAVTDLDLFVLNKMQEVGLEPSQEAAVPDLARRLALDLVGLPPSSAQIKDLGQSPTTKEWQKYIQSLLASSHFGEKWAGMWMDLARYADTKGYERDDARTIWRYRDWLIKAFNEDKPYDQFIVEQLAGDLLPDPTDDQLLATAFHRNTMTNDEGGTDNEEFRIAAVMDRVNTTWETLMGTSFTCVQCHSHPYDPIKHEDYYRFMAFFNDTRDEDTFDDYPVLRHLDSLEQVKLEAVKKWLSETATPERTDEIIRFIKTWQPSINSLTSDQFINSELSDTKWLVFRNNSSSRLKNVMLEGKKKLIYRYRSFLEGGKFQMHLDSLQGPVIAEVPVFNTKKEWQFNQTDVLEVSGTHDIYITYHNPNLRDPLANGLLFDWFYFTEPFPGEGQPGYEMAKDNFWNLVTCKTETTPIMLENPVEMHRTTFVFDRGNWLTPTDSVSPGLPRFMNKMNPDQPADRLNLARSIVDTENPLTARVFVNRVWEQLFGVGLVETSEDFGSQGATPFQEDLLDHLAYQFMFEFKWSLKSLLTYIVSSATYRQSSFVSDDHLRKDPQNKYLARGPRVRLSAEQVRDQALAISGLLNPEMFGPSVMPYQPDRIWNSPYNGRKWIESKDGQQYRRAIYTYWKRTSPYPSMLIFDMMAREVCTTRRINTNTPLQALVTLNDSVYVEAASQFAQRMIEEGGNSVEEQIKYGYQLMLFKEITPEKLEVLLDLYAKVESDEKKEDRDFNLVVKPEDHLLKMKIVANTMFNLDELISKS